MTAQSVKAVKSKPAKRASAPTFPPVAVDPREILRIPSGVPRDEALAGTVFRPTVQGAFTAKAILSPDFQEVHLGELIKTLSTQVKMVSEGDLSRSEAMLASHAQTLDLLFNRLTRVAVANIGRGHLEAVDTYMKLALRAQSQCRAVAETLHEMKHPRPVYVGQANFASGPQQVNNGDKAGFRDQYAHGRAGAGEIEKSPNELLEDANHGGEMLDGSATQTTTAGDPRLATVGAVNGSKVEGR